MGAALFYIGGAMIVFSIGAAVSDFILMFFWR